MRKKQMSLMDPAEAAALEQITVRRIEPAEQQRWTELISQHHYLQDASLVGESRSVHGLRQKQATVLGILRRGVQGEYRAWGRRIDRVIRCLTGEIPRL